MKYYGKEMDTIHPEGCVAMTWEDAEEMEKLNSKCNWGFSTADCLRFIADHMEAHIDAEQEDKDPHNAYKHMECIEWRLEDANFHTLHGFLATYDYKKAIEWVAADM